MSTTFFPPILNEFFLEILVFFRRSLQPCCPSVSENHHSEKKIHIDSLQGKVPFGSIHCPLILSHPTQYPTGSISFKQGSFSSESTVIKTSFLVERPPFFQCFSGVGYLRSLGLPANVQAKFPAATIHKGSEVKK